MSNVRRGWTGLAGALLLAASCGGPDALDIEAARRVTSPGALPGADEELRFHGHTAAAHGGGGAAHGGGAPTADELPFAWDMPQGWTEQPTTQFRLVNLRPADHPDAECFLSILPGTAGGLEANVNRWRAQMGLADLDAAGIAALPSIGLLGREATLVELEGAYSGMGDTASEGWAFLGAILQEQGVMVFVKMTGPADLLAAERDGFLDFCASIRPIPSGMPDEAGGTGGAAPSADAPDNGHGGNGEFTYVLPAGWSDSGASGMRRVNLAFGDVGQCYVIRLKGEAGGLLGNINRWRGEVGLEPIDEAGLALLPRVPMMGTEVALFEGSGSYQGMGGPEGGDMQVYGVALVRSTESLFIKLVAPVAEAEAQRDAFLAFVASLEEK